MGRWHPGNAGPTHEDVPPFGMSYRRPELIPPLKLGPHPQSCAVSTHRPMNAPKACKLVVPALAFVPEPLRPNTTCHASELHVHSRSCESPVRARTGACQSLREDFKAENSKTCFFVDGDLLFLNKKVLSITLSIINLLFRFSLFFSYSYRSTKSFIFNTFYVNDRFCRCPIMLLWRERFIRVSRTLLRSTFLKFSFKNLFEETKILTNYGRGEKITYLNSFGINLKTLSIFFFTYFILIYNYIIFISL